MSTFMSCGFAAAPSADLISKCVNTNDFFREILSAQDLEVIEGYDFDMDLWGSRCVVLAGLVEGVTFENTDGPEYLSKAYSAWWDFCQECGVQVSAFGHISLDEDLPIFAAAKTVSTTEGFNIITPAALTPEEREARRADLVRFLEVLQLPIDAFQIGFRCWYLNED